MKTWGQPKISSCCLCVWRVFVNGWKLFRRPSTSYKKLLVRVTFRIHTLAKSQSVRGTSHHPAFMDSCLSISQTRLACLLHKWVSPRCSIKRHWIQRHMELRQTSMTAELLLESMCWCKFFGELVLFEGMRMEFRDKIMSHYSREVKCHADSLNPGAQDEHLTSRISWVTAWL